MLIRWVVEEKNNDGVYYVSDSVGCMKDINSAILFTTREQARQNIRDAKSKIEYDSGVTDTVRKVTVDVDGRVTLVERNEL